jgi:hypothetical protein
LNHLQLALRNLKRRPARSILTAAGVALAVGSFITLYGLSQSVEQNVEQSIEEHGADLTVRRSGTAELFGGTIPASERARIAQITGVAAVSGELISLVATDRDEHVLLQVGQKTVSSGGMSLSKRDGCRFPASAGSHWSA